MKKEIVFIILAIFCGVILAGCFGIGDEDRELIKGSGNIKTVEKDFKDFSRIEINMGFQVNIIQSPNTTITLKVDDNIEKYLKVIKNGDTLSISLDKDKSYKNININANVTLPDLNSLSVDGGAHASVKGFDFDHEFKCTADGGGSAFMTGSGGKLTITASGGSNVDFGHFLSDDTTADLNGGSRITVHVNGILKVSASGGAHLYYYGNPTHLDISKSGGAQVTKMD